MSLCERNFSSLGIRVPNLPHSTLGSSLLTKNVFNPNSSLSRMAPRSLLSNQAHVSSIIDNNDNKSAFVDNEPDLTELSWLTNSFDVLHGSSIDLNSPDDFAKSTSNTFATSTEAKFYPIRQLSPPPAPFPSHTDDLDSSTSSLSSLLSASTRSTLSATTSNICHSNESTEIIPTLKTFEDELNSSHTSTSGAKSFKKKFKCKYPFSKVTSSAANQSVPVINTKKSDNEYHVKSKCLIVDKLLESTKNSSIFERHQVLQSDANLAKPPLTLSCLIFMAIEESKHKCLPVRDIYQWIESRFPYYNSVSKGWKSSIRHNLSFSKCFKKMDRSESTKLLSNQSVQSQNFNTKTLISGTCWKINPECKTYLTQALKKSPYWLSNMSQACNSSLKAAIESDEIDDKDYFASCQSENEKNDENVLITLSASGGGVFMKAEQNLNVSHEEVIIESSCNTGNCSDVEKMTKKSASEACCVGEDVATDNNKLKENIFEEHDANKSNWLPNYNRNKFYYKSNKILQNNNLKRRLSKSVAGGENTKRLKSLADSENSNRVKGDEICTENENICTSTTVNSNEDDVKKAAEEILMLNHNSTVNDGGVKEDKSSESVDCATNSDLEIEVASTLVRLKSLMENRN